MRIFAVIPALAAAAWAQEAKVAPAKAASQEVLVQARAAVAKLCKETTGGNYAYAIDSMNPQWLKRLAAKDPGGEKELRAKLGDAAKLMAKNGISIIASEPSAPANLLQSYEVGFGKQTVKRKGPDGVEREVEEQIYTQWLVLVPTITRFQVPVQNELRPAVFEKISFQVAVADKGKDNWTFIDGSSLSVSVLRSIYQTLPADLEFPPISEREIK